MRHRTLIILCALFVTFSLVDCAGCGGGGEARIEARTTTLGQELQDLKSAYDQGIITENEYKRKKKDLLDE